MLVILSFGCYLAAVNFRGDRGGICNFQVEAAVLRAVLWSGYVCPLVAGPGRRNAHEVECFERRAR